MKIDGLLPVGSVVLLKNGSHKVMIIGYCQKLVSGKEQIFDYVACLFPEGFISADKNYLFNQEQVDKVYHVGYQTDGQFAFAERMENAIEKLRSEKK